jgi:LPXTG-motif cell wall-anchored protein
MLRPSGKVSRGPHVIWIIVPATRGSTLLALAATASGLSLALALPVAHAADGAATPTTAVTTTAPPTTTATTPAATTPVAPPVAAGPAEAEPTSTHAAAHARTHVIRARAAAASSATIADFAFSPATITVHTGDTVTWTNDGPSSHTATATDGSFNTGVLKKGASASHTFTAAGTYSYRCQIHPFMHGTIVVLAGATPATGSGAGGSSARGSSAGSSTSTHPSTPTAAAPTLPNTGFDAAGAALAGALLLGAGLRLRRPGSER